MDGVAHKIRHQWLYQALDELAIDFMTHLAIGTQPVLLADLMKWSNDQMRKPSSVRHWMEDESSEPGVLVSWDMQRFCTKREEQGE